MRILLTASLFLVGSMANATDLEVPPPQIIAVNKGMFCETPEHVEVILTKIALKEEPNVEGCGLVQFAARMPTMATPLYWYDNTEVNALVAKLDIVPVGMTVYGWVDVIYHEDTAPSPGDPT